MNVFYLDTDPALCAEYHCDKHVVKMCTEYAQLLGGAHLQHGSWKPEMYRPQNLGNRYVRWAGGSAANYAWLYDLWLALGREYTRRYGKVHGALARATEMSPTLRPDGLDFWPPPACDAIVNGCPVEDGMTRVLQYRWLYRVPKRHMCTWKEPATTPEWFK